MNQLNLAPVVLTDAAEITTLLRQHQLCNLAVASLSGGGDPMALSLAKACRQVLGPTLFIDLCQKQQRQWRFDEISAHTEIQSDHGLALLPSPAAADLDSQPIADAMLRWHSEYPQVVMHCGELNQPQSWMAAQGCQGLVLVVNAAQDDEESLSRCLRLCQERQVSVVAVLLNQTQLPHWGEKLLQRWPWLSRFGANWLLTNPFLVLT